MPRRARSSSRRAVSACGFLAAVGVMPGHGDLHDGIELVSQVGFGPVDPGLDGGFGDIEDFGDLADGKVFHDKQPEGLPEGGGKRLHPFPDLLAQQVVVRIRALAGLHHGFQADGLVLQGAAFGEGKGADGPVQVGGGVFDGGIPLHEDHEGFLGNIFRVGGAIAPGVADQTGIQGGENIMKLMGIPEGNGLAFSMAPWMAPTGEVLNGPGMFPASRMIFRKLDSL